MAPKWRPPPLSSRGSANRDTLWPIANSPISLPRRYQVRWQVIAKPQRAGYACSATSATPARARVKEFRPFLLQIPQHVFGNRRKSLSDDDVKAERRQRSRLERLRASHLLLQGLLGCVLPGDSAETDALERGPSRLR